MPAIEITISKAEQQRLIQHMQAELIRQMAHRIRSNNRNLSNLVRNYIQTLDTTPIVHELKSGSLGWDLGVLPNEVDNVISGIIKIISGQIMIDLIVSKSYVKVEVGIFRLDSYDAILAIDGADFVQEFFRDKNDDPNRPYTVPWLEWLLLKGHNPLVPNRHVLYSIKVGTKTRTGHAIMGRGGSFMLPRQLAGTALDNFVTRALDQMGRVVEKELVNILS